MAEVITEKRYLKDLINLTYAIKLRPGLYIGKKSIVRLHQFLNGFSEAYYYIDAENKNFGVYPGFQEWIYNKYRAEEAISWSSIILDHSDNEEEAVDLFFEEVEIYIEQKRWLKILETEDE